MKEKLLLALAEAAKSRDLWREIAASCEEYLDEYPIVEIEFTFWPGREGGSGQRFESTKVSLSSLLFAAHSAAIDCQEFLDAAGVEGHSETDTASEK